MASFSDLPPELVLRTLSYLPLHSLLSFAQTSHASFILASASVHTLSLGIFPSRLASLIGRLSSSDASSPLPHLSRPSSSSSGSSASIEADPFEDCIDPYGVSIIIPAEIARSLSLIKKFQNGLASSVVARYAHALRHIDLSVWSINAATAGALAKCTRLRSLSLQLDHPYVRHRHVDRHYWDRAAGEGSTVWNAFDGAWGCLETIRFEGVGITDWQLQRILEANTNVSEISVSNCQLLGHEFWKFIAKSWGGRAKLRVLKFMGSLNREIDSSVLSHVRILEGLEYLSFHGCQYLNNDEVEQMNKDVWHIPRIVMPKPIYNPADVIEVDPAFTIPQVATVPSTLVPSQA